MVPFLAVLTWEKQRLQGGFRETSYHQKTNARAHGHTRSFGDNWAILAILLGIYQRKEDAKMMLQISETWQIV